MCANVRKRTLTCSLLASIIAVELKRPVVAANRNDAKTAVGSEVGRRIDMCCHEEQANAQPHRETAILQETFFCVLRIEAEFYQMRNIDAGDGGAGSQSRAWPCT